jgi:hypothetical protein
MQVHGPRSVARHGAAQSLGVFEVERWLVDYGLNGLADHLPIPAVASTDALEHVSDLEHEPYSWKEIWRA